jgi:hypothetical protein
MPGESSAVPTEDGVGLNRLEASPRPGPESAQQNPKEPVAAREAQAMRRVLLRNRELVRKREDLHLQGSTGSMSSLFVALFALLVVATMISPMIRTSVFSDRLGFSVATAMFLNFGAT